MSQPRPLTRPVAHAAKFEAECCLVVGLRPQLCKLIELLNVLPRRVKRGGIWRQRLKRVSPVAAQGNLPWLSPRPTESGVGPSPAISDHSAATALWQYPSFCRRRRRQPSMAESPIVARGTRKSAAVKPASRPGVITIQRCAAQMPRRVWAWKNPSGRR